MNTEKTNLIIGIVGLFLATCACVAAWLVVPSVERVFSQLFPPPTPLSQFPTFDYQIRVQSQETGLALQNAKVTIEVGGNLAPIIEYADSNGFARVTINIERAGKPGKLIVEATGYKRYAQNIDLIENKLPSYVQLETDLQSVASTPAPSATLVLPTPLSTVTPTPPTASLATIVLSVEKAEIDEPITTTVCVTPNVEIEITATGNMVVGSNIGLTDPDGKDNFSVFGVQIPIEKDWYSLPEFSHGSLLCRIGEDADWEQCGSRKTLTAEVVGCVELAINDSFQTDNEGDYEVTIEVAIK